VTLLAPLALLVSLLVAAPYLAHRLRRRRADERLFAAARLVSAAPPQARRRSRLEDRALFATRALAVLALALLGASPLVRCSRLSLSRSGGASVAVALIVDDSMSMRADAGGTPRFEKARHGARELVDSARDGDAIAIVLAGAPARVALPATTDLGAARAVLDALTMSDRGTDLDGAITIGRGLVAGLPQVDRRVVVLSDLADGNPSGPAVGAATDSRGIPIWVALPELRARADDCGILSADRRGARVRVVVACAAGTSTIGRDVLLVDSKQVVLTRTSLGVGEGADVTLTLPNDDATDVTAKLGGVDAIASDDVAPVVTEAGPGAVAVVADTGDEAAATGGAPIVEQALAALKLDVAVRPLPAVPERAEDFAPFFGVLMDDPPGLTPEQRHALDTFVQGGGVVLVALGPHAAEAPLGATFEPILTRPIAWRTTTSTGADPATAVGPIAESAASLVDLAATHRAVLDSDDAKAFTPFVGWTDGAPLVARRSLGRGDAWLTTLPFSVTASDLTLRPAFLSLLDAWVAEGHARAAPRRTDVGATWAFTGARDVRVDGPAGVVAITRDAAGLRVSPPLLGAYRIVVDGKPELRVAAPVQREIDLRPRAAAPQTATSALGDNHASVDISSRVALALLALLFTELALRAWTNRRDEAVA
jgi:Mg-chelatase subunit ChlD